jgi:hypothetical protein
MATLEQIKISAADLRAASQAVQHLDPTISVEITRGNGMTVLAWGTAGATIYDGKIVPTGE